MRFIRFLIIGVSLSVLSGCFWNAPSDNGGSTSSMSSLSSSVASADSQPVSASLGEFAKREDETYIGAITLTGYAVVKDRKEVWCDRDCKTFQGVSFTVTDGMTPALRDFIASYGPIFLGCKNADGSIVREVSVANRQLFEQRTIPVDEASVLLKSAPRNLVTVTLLRDFEPAGTEAPSCYSQFQGVTVTD